MSHQGGSVKMSAPPAAGTSTHGARQQTARSSRRKVGSTGPQVVLGGGAGILGSASASASGSSSAGYGGRDVQYASQASTSSHFPVQFPSPSTGSFPSPISPLFPNMFRAPSPLPQPPSKRDKPVDLPPPPPQTQIQTQTATHAPTSSISSSQDEATSMDHQRAAPGSTSSLSTAASTSSRTLKTPHSKADRYPTHIPQPSIVSSSDSHESQPSSNSPSAFDVSPVNPMSKAVQRPDPVGVSKLMRKERERESSEQRSPTPTQRSLPKTSAVTVPASTPQQGATKVDQRLTSSVRGTSPPSLPTKDVSLNSGTTEPTGLPQRPMKAKSGRGTTPPHLDLSKTHKANARLSQDWIQIDFPGGPSMAPAGVPLQPIGNRVTSQSSDKQGSVRLPSATMVPMKGNADSPVESKTMSRPSFDRANSAPMASPPAPADRAPSKDDGSSEQRKGRVSLDKLRSNTSPDGVPQRARKNSLSTPPSVMLSAGSTSTPPTSGTNTSSVGRLNLFRSNTRTASPNLGSDATKRPSMDVGDARISIDQRDYLKAMQKEQQRMLGAASGRYTMDEPRSSTTSNSIDTDRKPSGLSLKKSSGALKALFNRTSSGGKGKERTDNSTPTPPLPHNLPLQNANLEQRGRHSLDTMARPSFARQISGQGQGQGRDARDARATPSPAMLNNGNGQGHQQARHGSDTFPARPSFTSDRSNYPIPPFIKDRARPARPSTGPTRPSGSQAQPQGLQPTAHGAQGGEQSRPLTSVPMSGSRSEPPVSNEQQRHDLRQKASQGPNRDLPPLPPPSPNPAVVQLSEEAKVIARQTLAGIPAETPLQNKLSTLAQVLPTSYLPYLSSMVGELEAQHQHQHRSDQSSQEGGGEEDSSRLRTHRLPTSVSYSSTMEGKSVESSPMSFTTARDVSPNPGDGSTGTSSSTSTDPTSTTRPFTGRNLNLGDELDIPLPPPQGMSLATSRSLHLLQLPDLNLDFDLSFESIGISPSTPRHRHGVSPQKKRTRSSPNSNSPHSPSPPQRAMTTRVSSSRISRAGSGSPGLPRSLSRRNSEIMLTSMGDRRRSRSFDGPSSSTSAQKSLGDLWGDSTAQAAGGSSGAGGAFAQMYTPTSASAPLASMALEPSSSDDGPMMGTGMDVLGSASGSTSGSGSGSISGSTSTSSTITPQSLSTADCDYPFDYELGTSVQGRVSTSVPVRMMHVKQDRQGSLDSYDSHSGSGSASASASGSGSGSGPSSSDHARTPSGTSSTHDTESPSPPRTPPNPTTALAQAGAGAGAGIETGYDDVSGSPSESGKSGASEPTPKALNVNVNASEKLEGLRTMTGLGLAAGTNSGAICPPPSIPLPALPTAVPANPAIVLGQSATDQAIKNSHINPMEMDDPFLPVTPPKRSPTALPLSPPPPISSTTPTKQQDTGAPAESAKPTATDVPPIHTLPVPSDPMSAGVAPPSTRPPVQSHSTLPLSPSFLVDPPKLDDSHLKPTGQPIVAAVRPARAWKTILTAKSKVVVPEDKSLRALAQSLEVAINSFRGPGTILSSGDRCNIVRTQLLPILAEIERRPFFPQEEVTNRALREVAFDWAEGLLYELRVEQAANERGTCLEGLANVLESSCLSEIALRDDRLHRVRFINLMVSCMRYVMGKLGAKGVFHNTLLFSGRFLAFAFFRIPHVAEQLVTVLQLPRGALMRFTRVAMQGPAVTPSARPRYPEHLLPLCFDDSRSYATRLASLSPSFASEEERSAFLFTPGNWLRRWQSDDSELFPAFYRAYHRQLAMYLAPAVQHYETLGEAVPIKVLLQAPGYAHLATIFAKKCHAYILGSINAVTTSSSTQAFDATESAGIKASQKPPVLETANRRLTETLATLINSHILIPSFDVQNKGSGGAKSRIIECDGQQLWSSILNLWTRTLISKTSLYAPKGVFSLFDLLDGIVDPPYDPITGERRLREVSLLDVPHLIHIIRLILTQAEHALTIVKVVAFVFTHWEALTARHEDRQELCLELLLEKSLFERLTLFWSQSVRSYVLRLVVFRLGHVHTTKEDGLGHEVEIDSVRLLQTRLDKIRKRYNELEPKPSTPNVDSTTPNGESPFFSPMIDGIPRSRSTITMVTDSPRAPSNKAERLLGLGLGNMDKPGGGLEVEEGSRMGKAKGWLKKSFANKKKKNPGSATPSPSLSSTSPSESPRLSPSPRVDPSSNSGRFASPLLVNGHKTPRPSLDGQQPTKKKSGNAQRPHGRSMSTPPQIVSLDSPELDGESPPSAPRLGPGFASSGNRRQPPPDISTNTPSNSSSSPASSLTSGGLSPGFAFEFELPTTSPRSDTFDPTPNPTPASPRRNSQPPSPTQRAAGGGGGGGPTSPHMSKSFSKRSSLLPPGTASILANEMASPMSKKRAEREREAKQEEERGYDAKLHAYAIRMLAELEDAQKEYDEWWSEGGIGKVDGAPPRLTVAWPFHEGDE